MLDRQERGLKCFSGMIVAERGIYREQCVRVDFLGPLLQDQVKIRRLH
jgi:hypothetical protein